MSFVSDLLTISFRYKAESLLHPMSFVSDQFHLVTHLSQCCIRQ